MPLHVEIVTQEGKIFEELEADMVIVPGSEGEMGILPRHAPILTTMGFGELRVKKGNAEEDFIIYGGIVEVRPGRVIALADMAESSFAVDVTKAQEARTRAQELMKSGVGSEDEATLLTELRRAELAVRISTKARQRGGLRIRSVIENEDT
jgi:F-type H+-transporting ATPase subunit epsilon